MGQRALIIAIERYPRVEDGSIATELPGTIKQALDFREWLTRKWDGSGIADDERQIVFCSEPAIDGGRGASIDDIKTALDELQSAGRDGTDEYYLYFSGHGFTFDRKVTRSSMLIAADYRSMKLSGDRCANLDWMVLWLTMNMGPGRHYYFVDACSNVLDGSVIQPPDALLPNDPNSAGEPDTFLLQSSPPNATAPADGSFSNALLEGLAGRGRAKVWDTRDPDAMVVRFDTLRDFVKQRIGRKIHQSVKGDGGEASGVLLTLKPPPHSKCTIHLTGGDATGTATFEGARGQVRRPFDGRSSLYELPPDVYRIRLELGETKAAPSEQVVSLYDDADTTFSLNAETIAAGETVATTSIVVPPDTSLFLENLDGLTSRRLAGGMRHEVPRGSYSAVLTDAQDKIIKSDELFLDRSDPVDITHWTRSIFGRLNDRHFAEDIVNIPGFLTLLRSSAAEGDTDTWLALLGAGYILHRPLFPQAPDLDLPPLDGFLSEVDGASPLLILGAFEETGTQVEVSVSSAAGDFGWYSASGSTTSPLRHFRARTPSGPLLISLRKGGDAAAYTVSALALPNRVTLITVTQNDADGFTIGQYSIPIDHLSSPDHPAPPTERSALADVLATSMMIKSFRDRRRLHDLPWFSYREVIEGYWRNPIAMLLTAYDLARRRDDHYLRRLVPLIEYEFKESPDAWILRRRLVGTKFDFGIGFPVFLDGFIAAGGSAVDLPPGSSLDYSSAWTAWHEFPQRS